MNIQYVSINLKEIRKLILLILMTLPTSLLSQGVLQQKVDFIIEDLSIPEALMILSEASEIEISFDPKLLNQNAMIDLHEIDVPIESILEKCLKGQAVEFVVIDNKIIVRSNTFKPYYVSGFIKDEINGESVAGATIQNLIHDDIVTSNAYGYYSMPIKDASSILLVSHPKFASSSTIIALPTPKLDIKLNSDSKKDSLLSIETLAYQEQELYLSNIGYSRSSFQNTAEPDVIQNFNSRSSNMGVNEGPEANSYWGGAPHHTSVFIDGIRLYRGQKAIDMSANFNSRLIKNQSNHQHLIPAKYSGNLSSVQAVETNVGSMEYPGIDIGVNSLIGNFTIDAPIVKNRANFIISYRQNISDIWNQKWVEMESNRNFSALDISQDYRDIYAKVNVKIKSKHVLSAWRLQSEELTTNFSEFSSVIEPGISESSATISSSMSNVIDYNQSISALNWQYAANPKMILNATFSQTDLNDNKFSGWSGTQQLHSGPYTVSQILAQRTLFSQMEGKLSFDYFHNDGHYMQFGLQTDIRKFSPGIIIENLAEIVNHNSNNNIAFDDNLFDKNTEIRMFFQDKISLEKYDANLGITAGTIGTTDLNYFFAEPRLAFTYKPNKKTKFSINVFSANQYHQSPNFLGSNLPINFLVSSSFKNPPEKSWQIHLGHLRKVSRYTTIAIDLYNKEYSNLSKWRNQEFLDNDTLYLRSDNYHIYTNNFNSSVQGVDLKFISKVRRFRITGKYGLIQSKFSSETGQLPSNFKSDILSQQINLNLNVNLSDGFQFGFMWTVKMDSDRNTLSYFPSITSISYNEFESTIERADDFLMYHRLDFFTEYTFKKNNGIHNFYLKVFNAYDQKNVTQFLYDDNVENSVNNYLIFGQGLTPSIGYQYSWRKRKVSVPTID